MTVFGYNTDIRREDKVYHVQTEARENDFVLISSVFVRGRCVGKHSTSYAGEATSEQQVHEMLTAQHRLVLDMIRQGGLEKLLSSARQNRESLPMTADSESLGPEQKKAPHGDDGPDDTEVKPSRRAVEELRLECLAIESATSDEVRVRICLRMGARAVPNASVVGRLERPDHSPVYFENVTDDNGEVQLALQVGKIEVDGRLTVLIQANANQQSLTRRFALRRS